MDPEVSCGEDKGSALRSMIETTRAGKYFDAYHNSERRNYHKDQESERWGSIAFLRRIRNTKLLLGFCNPPFVSPLSHFIKKVTSKIVDFSRFL